MPSLALLSSNNDRRTPTAPRRRPLRATLNLATALAVAFGSSLLVPGVASADAAPSSPVSGITVYTGKTTTPIRISTRTVVTTKKLPIKATCSTRAKTLKSIPKNMALTTSYTTKVGCYRVSYSGKSGWIAKSGIKAIKQVSLTKRTLVLRKATALRSACAVKAPSLRTVPKGAVLTTSATTNLGCYKVSYSGKTGWIAKSDAATVTVAAKKYPKFSNPALNAKLRWNGPSVDQAKAVLSAHRGGARDGGGAQPQTLNAFHETLNHGVTDLEFDIRFTKDDVAVVTHDATSACAPTGVQNVTFEDLVAANHSEETTAGCGLTLEDLIGLAKDWERTHGQPVFLRAETKTYSGQPVESQREYARRLAQLAVNSEIKDHFVLASFNLDNLKEFKRVDPELFTQALVTRPAPSTILAAAAAGADEYSYSASPGAGGSRWLNEFVHRNGMQATTWFGSVGFNAPVFAKQLSQGADKIIVDWPDRVAGAISSHTCQPVWKDTKNVTLWTGTLKPGQAVSPKVLGSVAGQPKLGGLENATVRVTLDSAATSAGVQITPSGSAAAQDRASLQRTGDKVWEAAGVPGQDGRIQVASDAKVAQRLSLQITGYTENTCRAK